MLKNFTLLVVAVLFFGSCASKKIKDITYLETNSTESNKNLNIFKPRKKADKLRPVVIFVHGGNWNSGDKNTYGFLGRNFAKNDIVTVIPSYTLSPNANYDTMASQIAEAYKWTSKNIEKYGGNTNEIYLMGHSAGGHLIALISTNPKYLEDKSSLKGVILNDAAGLDTYSRLKQNPPRDDNNYTTTWTENPEIWKDASPIYFLSKDSPKFLIYVGKKSYDTILTHNSTFIEELKNYQPNVEPIYLDKKHVPMMTQYIWPWSKRYDEISEFIQKTD